jgi:serine/threonine protein kinase
MHEVVFGRYPLIAVLGEGAMGKVNNAHDTVMGRAVAIEVLPPDLATEPGLLVAGRRQNRKRHRHEAHRPDAADHRECARRTGARPGDPARDPAQTVGSTTQSG